MSRVFSALLAVWVGGESHVSILWGMALPVLQHVQKGQDKTVTSKALPLGRPCAQLPSKQSVHSGHSDHPFMMAHTEEPPTCMLS